MTWITNVDGEYWADDPRDFCHHGVYVGGCGYDFMCGACELGEPDPTPRELVEGLASYLQRLAKHAIVLAVHEDSMKQAQGKLNQRAAEIREACEYATSMDDDQWMRTKREAEIKKFMESSK